MHLLCTLLVTNQLIEEGIGVLTVQMRIPSLYHDGGLGQGHIAQKEVWDLNLGCWTSEPMLPTRFGLDVK